MLKFRADPKLAAERITVAMEDAVIGNYPQQALVHVAPADVQALLDQLEDIRRMVNDSSMPKSTRWKFEEALGGV